MPSREVTPTVVVLYDSICISCSEVSDFGQLYEHKKILVAALNGPVMGEFLCNHSPRKLTFLLRDCFWLVTLFAYEDVY